MWRAYTGVFLITHSTNYFSLKARIKYGRIFWTLKAYSLICQIWQYCCKREAKEQLAALFFYANKTTVVQTPSKKNLRKSCLNIINSGKSTGVWIYKFHQQAMKWMYAASRIVCVSMASRVWTDVCSGIGIRQKFTNQKQDRGHCALKRLDKDWPGKVKESEMTWFCSWKNRL